MKATLGIVLVAGAAIGVWKWQSTTPSHKVTVTDRIWIDHIPANPTEKINAFVLATKASAGVFDTSSQWEGAYQIFKFEQHDDEIRALFPQTSKRETWTAQATPCGKNDFDYCLELKGASQGVKRYYSMKGWEVRGTDLDAEVHRALAK